MRTLIVADLHHRVDEAEKIIKLEKPDQTIFLGDYWDDFNDTPEMVTHTTEWFSWSVDQPNRIHLFGNHDLSYFNAKFACSGWEQWKTFIISDIVSNKDWEKLKTYYFLDNTFLLSHAGLHKLHVPDYIISLRGDRNAFYKELDIFLQQASEVGFKANSNISWIFNAGKARGGYFQNVGGLTWCDFEREFYPIVGLNQICGHTPNTRGKAMWCNMDTPNVRPFFKLNLESCKPLSIKKLSNTDASYNLCLDVWKHTHYAIWNGEKLEVKSV
jgi:hypothetical protein